MRNATNIYKGFITAIIVIIFLMFLNTLTAQNIGLNGQGYLENRTEQSDIWIKEAVGDKVWTLRFPGGAATKYVDPLNGNGWGITYELVDSITAKYGSDEEEATADAVTKWRRKSDAQPDYSYLDDIVWLQQEFPNLRVIWSANYLIPAERAFYPIEYLINNGVNIVCVEIGNESYSQMNYDFDAYWQRSRGIVEMCKSLLIPVAYPIPATGLRGSKSHDNWIASLNAVINGDGVVSHPYYDKREFPSLETPIDTQAAFLEIAAWDFNGQFQDIKSEVTNGGFFIVTESNSQPAALIGDTELNAYLIERLLIAGSQEFQDFTIHNGVAPDKYGIIYGTNGQKRNTSYFAFQSVMSNVPDIDTVTIQCDTIITPATYDTAYITTYIQPKNPKCNRFFYKIFHGRDCKVTEVITPVITLVTESDTLYVNCQEQPDTTATGCKSTTGTNNGSSYCKSGSNDDYLHPERFINPDGSLICDAAGVVFDHRINTKFETTIRNAIFDSTGVWIDLDFVDFFITLPETGQTVKFYDIFNWCDENGNPTWFNTNQLVFNEWSEFLTGKRMHTFEVEMWDRETGILISYFWQDHTTMDLLFTGLY